MKWKQPCFFLCTLGGFFLWIGISYAVNLGTSVVASQSAILLSQGDYRWYENVNSLTPSVSIASETTATTTPSAGSVIRLRMNVRDTSLQLDAGATFRLQYSNTTSSGWTDLATSTSWIFFDNSGVADGQTIVITVLSSSDVGESYDESNPSAATPTAIQPSQRGEWDWVVQNSSAGGTSNWYFRMVYSSGTVFNSYLNYPTLTGASISTSTGGGGGGTVSVAGGGGGTGLFTTSSLPRALSPCLSLIVQRIDLNGDCRIDIIDLSILLYYYHQTTHDALRADFNDDGEVGLTDVSILLYYWTQPAL